MAVKLGRKRIMSEETGKLRRDQILGVGGFLNIRLTLLQKFLWLFIIVNRE